MIQSLECRDRLRFLVRPQKMGCFLEGEGGISIPLSLLPINSVLSSGRNLVMLLLVRRLKTTFQMLRRNWLLSSWESYLKGFEFE